MEIFKDTHYDFLGKKWPFIIGSLVLLTAGFVSMAVKGGLKLGIDFKGGAVMTVKFASRPEVEKIREAMANAPQIRGEVSVQNFTSFGIENEVEIGTELQDERQLNINRQAMADVLKAAFAQQGGGKVDVNNTGQDALVDRLRSPLAAAGVAMSDQQLRDLVRAILSQRDARYSGLFTDFNQISSVPGINPGIMSTLRQEVFLAPYHIVQTQMVGPKVGADLRNKAVLATLYALAGMLVYIAFRFEWVYGVGAVIAVLHDTLVTLGLFSIFNYEITMTVIAALLTLVGYSMNDTIVIFDRVRENSRMSRRRPLDVVMNEAVNQTLGRTVMTSGLTFLTAVSLFIWGGPVLKGFAFALVVGIIAGTYSTMFIASPIVLFWHSYFDKRKARPSAVAAGVRPDVKKTPTKVVK